VTGGSASTQDAWLKLRSAAAVTRALLLREAAERWGPASNEDTLSGMALERGAPGAGAANHGAPPIVVRWTAGGGQSIEVGKLVSNLRGASAAPRERNFRILGKPLDRPRVDARDKVTGEIRIGMISPSPSSGSGR
jgi:isoquinoline 1-oxidoreductase subunit beta